MPTNYTHIFQAPIRKGVYNNSVADLAANTILILSADGQVGGLPAAIVASGSVGVGVILGTCEAIIPIGKIGDVACTDGDVVALKADHTAGAIAAGDRITFGVTGGRVGYAQKTTAASLAIIGHALEASTADGQLIYVRVQIKPNDS